MSFHIRGSDKTVTSEQAIKLAQDLWETIDTPVSLGLWIRCYHGDFKSLVNTNFYPTWYDDPVRASLDYQAISVLRKADFLDTKIDRRKAALSKFWDSEERCAETNGRFDALMYGKDCLGNLVDTNPRIAKTLFRAQALIQRILGDSPDDVCSYDDMRFGPGATYLVGGRKRIHLPNKYSHKMAVTPELLPYLPSILGPRWFSNISEVTLRKGNVVGFVPKDAKVDRVIAIEPDGNVLAQLGVAAGIRRRLKPYISLDEGATWNRYLCSVAHEYRLSTVDFSSASDTIARALVAFLLPEKWWLLLDTIRSHQFSLDGEWHVSEKFSSMGNGATFELESLIFYSLARACGSSRALTTTFGDDVILETVHYDLFREVAEYCGFLVNEEKTFSNSAFYESCGEDYFWGENIRPFQWKSLKANSVFTMFNDLKRFAFSKGIPEAGDLAEELYEVHPQLKECLVPEGNEDYHSVGFGVPFDRALPFLKRPRRGFCGMSTKALMFRPQKEDTHHWGGLMANLHALERRKAPRELGHLGDPPIEYSRSPIRGRGSYYVTSVTVLEW